MLNSVKEKKIIICFLFINHKYLHVCLYWYDYFEFNTHYIKFIYLSP